MPNIEHFFSKTPFLSQPKYPVQTFIWENIFSQDLVISIEATAAKLTNTAAGETNPVRQLEMMKTTKDYLDKALTHLYLHSAPDDVTPGKRDLRNRLHKSLGRACIILYMLTSDETVKPGIEQCARYNLRTFVDHEGQVDPEKADFPYNQTEFIKVAKGWLGLEDFSTLKFVK